MTLFIDGALRPEVKKESLAMRRTNVTLDQRSTRKKKGKKKTKKQMLYISNPKVQCPNSVLYCHLSFDITSL